MSFPIGGPLDRSLYLHPFLADRTITVALMLQCCVCRRRRLSSVCDVMYSG